MRRRGQTTPPSDKSQRTTAADMKTGEEPVTEAEAAKEATGTKEEEIAAQGKRRTRNGPERGCKFARSLKNKRRFNK
jgi:hypothetical protein